MLDPQNTLPDDGFAGALAGRVWRPDVGGPAVVALRREGVFDVSAAFPTMADVTEAPDPAAALRAATGERPVSKEARDGTHCGAAVKARSKTMPSRPKRSRFGVRIQSAP